MAIILMQRENGQYTYWWNANSVIWHSWLFYANQSLHKHSYILKFRVHLGKSCHELKGLLRFYFCKFWFPSNICVVEPSDCYWFYNQLLSRCIIMYRHLDIVLLLWYLNIFCKSSQIPAVLHIVCGSMPTKMVHVLLINTHRLYLHFYI